MVITIVLLLIALLLYGYSFLRYRYLWSRGRIPNVVYYVFQVLLLGTLFVCLLFSYRIVNDYVMLGVQFICDIYLTVMLLTPFFCLCRGAIRMLGKHFQWKNVVYRFFNHPSKSSKIVLGITLALGVGVFVQSKIPRVFENTVHIEKTASTVSLTVATVSDLQIGRHMTRFEIRKFFEQLEQLQPDLVVLNGNFYSYPANPSLREFTKGYLKKLVSEVPVYLIEGPNEVKETENSLEEIENVGVRLLRDETIQTAEGIQLIGCRNQENEKRRQVSYTFTLTDKNKPAILFSYQDLSEEEKRAADYDVLLSATPNRRNWFMPKQIQLTRLQFTELD